MPNTRDIRRRIKSVKNTSQITQGDAAGGGVEDEEGAGPGARRAALRRHPQRQVINRLKKRLEDDAAHPLLEERSDGSGKELVIVVNTDKGLCGGLNTNLLKATLAGASGDADFATVGRKLGKTLAKSGKNLVAEFSIDDPIPFSDCKTIAKFATEKFLEGEYDSVKVAFTNFVNTLTQTPAVETLLPVSLVELGNPKDYEGMGQEGAEAEADSEAKQLATSGYLYEPTPAGVFDTAVPMYVNYQFYQMVLEARASEHSARMVAMKSATDNANQLVKDLTLEYNKVRQAAITNELLEITTAMKALE